MALAAWTRPRALRPGDLLGVCAPGGPIDEAKLRAGMAELEALGFRVRLADGVLRRTRFTAGSRDERLAQINALIADDEVAAIVCARGGAGAGWLVSGIDTERLRARPKLLVGYSDVTALHLLMNRLAITSVHGPMLAFELASGSYDRDSFSWALAGQGQPYTSDTEDLLLLRPGEAQGRLRGGCLSLIAAAAGTPWALQPAGEDTILFLEDVDEEPYRVDRMLLTLRASGAFDGVRGVVFGDMKGCSPSVSADYGLEEVIQESLAGLDVPVALGLSSGHTTSPFITLPLGVRARLSCGAEARFEVLEAPVA